MTKTSILVCRDARRSEWQLGRLPPAAGRMTLIGWTQQPEPHDAGVPQEVAAVLARALTSVARVTFPSSIVHPSPTASWSQSGAALVRGLTAASTAGRVAAALKGAPGHVALVSTRDPETTRRGFDDAGYPWWMQGQALLLSAPDGPPPDISRDHLLALFDEDWAAAAATLADAGVVGIVRPGVDGDLAGLLSLAPGFDDVTLAALQKEARSAAFDWSVVTEEDFARRYSG